MAKALSTGRYHFVARSDARSYYTNIQHATLLQLLRRHTANSTLLSLVEQYCTRTLVKDGYYHTPAKGISLGCPFSPLMSPFISRL